MSKLKIGLIQQRNTENIHDNIARITEKTRNLASRGARLVVNQELHDTLYFCQTEDVNLCNLAIGLESSIMEHYSALAKEAGVVLVTSVFERRAPGLYHNTAVVFEKDGSVAGTYRKMHIPDDPAYYEKFYFTPGDKGFVPVETSVGKLGVMVCWDQWYPEAARLMALAGAEMLIYPTAIGWTPSDIQQEKDRQLDAWTTVQRGHAVANGLPVIAVNRVGHEDSTAPGAEGIDFWGNSFIAGPQGEWLYRAPTNSEAEIVVELDMERCENVRRWWPFLRDRRIDAYSGITERYLEKE